MNLLLNDKVMCLPCAAHDHWMCFHPKIDKCCCIEVEEVFENISSDKSIKGGYQKSPDSITDVTSTGRKRAAIMYPIEQGMVCEWSGLKYAGGGVLPIVGCMHSHATAIHHGPDKNTLNNTPENVHRICADCHNRWHAANDTYYGERPAGTEPFIPLDGWQWFGHNSTDKATAEELMNAAAGEWKLREAMKINERSAPTSEIAVATGSN